MKDRLTAKAIRISSIAAAKDVEFRPGTVTAIEGKNTAGKSSILNAIQSIPQGGRQAHLLRDGEEEGTVTILFETSERKQLIVKKTIRPDDTTLEVLADGVPIEPPKEFLNKLWVADAANPIKFVFERSKERTKLLLQALNLPVPEQDLRAIAGEHAVIDADAFTAIEQSHKAMYSRRTEVNRISTDAKKTVKSLGLEAVEDVGALDSQMSSDRESRNSLEEQRDDRLAENERGETEEQVKLEEEKQEAIRAAEQRYAEGLVASARHRRIADSRVQEEFDPQLEALNESITRIETRRDESMRADGRRQLRADKEQEQRTADAESKELTAALKSLDHLRAGILRKIPIKDVEVVQGEIYFEGREWKKLSESEKIRIALQVGRLRVGEIGLICADGLESFDDDTFALFVQEAQKFPEVQWLCGRVTRGPLKVYDPFKNRKTKAGESTTAPE